MARVPVGRRPATGLPEIAYAERRQVPALEGRAELLNELDQQRVAEVAVPLGLHHDVVHAFERELLGALHAARAVAADGQSRAFRRVLDPAPAAFACAGDTGDGGHGDR